MDSGPAKRRKLDYAQGHSENVLQSVASGGLLKNRTFKIETDELLEEVGLDYSASFQGADALLLRIKGSIEAIETHGALPVCSNTGFSLGVSPC